MTDKKERAEQSLKRLKDPDNSFEQLLVAICLTQLERYPDARSTYDLALQSSFKDRLWHMSSEPNLLVNIYMMAGRPDLYARTWKEVEAYKSDRRGKSLWALYAYAMIRLMSGKDEEAYDYALGLLKKPTVKDTFAMGQTIQAIVECSQDAFDVALADLLNVHRGMARFGGLRGTPEGYLCMPAMSLSRIALERGMQVNTESEYLSRGYLDYLLQRQDSSRRRSWWFRFRQIVTN
jgi:tetratricopeptide (TPR) repeat protein